MAMSAGGPPQSSRIERGKGVERGAEKLGDPSALNEQEVSVVDMFAESYNPGMPAGGGGGGQGDDDDDAMYKDTQGRQQAKSKFENNIQYVMGRLGGDRQGKKTNKKKANKRKKKK